MVDKLWLRQYFNIKFITDVSRRWFSLVKTFDNRLNRIRCRGLGADLSRSRVAHPLCFNWRGLLLWLRFTRETCWLFNNRRYRLCTSSVTQGRHNSASSTVPFVRLDRLNLRCSRGIDAQGMRRKVLLALGNPRKVLLNQQLEKFCEPFSSSNSRPTGTSHVNPRFVINQQSKWLNEFVSAPSVLKDKWWRYIYIFLYLLYCRWQQSSWFKIFLTLLEIFFI